MAQSTRFPHKMLVVFFRAVGAGYMLSRAWRRLHVYPRLGPVTGYTAF